MVDLFKTRVNEFQNWACYTADCCTGCPGLGPGLDRFSESRFSEREKINMSVGAWATESPLRMYLSRAHPNLHAKKFSIPPKIPIFFRLQRAKNRYIISVYPENAKKKPAASKK